VAVLGFTFWGASGVAIIAAGGTDLYCHSEPTLTSGKLCFIINFIGGPERGHNFYWGPRPSWTPFEPPLCVRRLGFLIVILQLTNEVERRRLWTRVMVKMADDDDDDDDDATHKMAVLFVTKFSKNDPTNRNSN